VAITTAKTPEPAPEEALATSIPRVKDEAASIATVNASLQGAYFAYDRSELTTAALATLRNDADLLCAVLADFPGLKIVVEGHSDERGSAEYNLGLGDRRAGSAQDVLRQYGVPAAAIDVVSYGKEAPQCTEPNESCWQRNRRAHVSVKR
jgi:peptidoglycan-associated lipoprotein